VAAGLLGGMLPGERPTRVSTPHLQASLHLPSISLSPYISSTSQPRTCRRAYISHLSPYLPISHLHLNPAPAGEPISPLYLPISLYLLYISTPHLQASLYLLYISQYLPYISAPHLQASLQRARAASLREVALPPAELGGAAVAVRLPPCA